MLVVLSKRLTGALLDRLTHHVHILEMNGESYRLKCSRENAQPPAPDDPDEEQDPGISLSEVAQTDQPKARRQAHSLQAGGNRIQPFGFRIPKR